MNLLKKEIKELLNVQLIVSLLFTLSLFYFMGILVQGEKEKMAAPQEVAILDLDGSSVAQGLAQGLSSANFHLNKLEEKSKEEAIEKARGSGASLLVVIPSGFGEAVSSFQSPEIETYYFIRGVSISSTGASGVLKMVIAAMNDYLSSSFLKDKVPGVDPERLKNPLKNRDFVVVKDRIEEGSPAEVINFLMSQSTFIPIILMLIIIYSSQMVISAVAMEKENKTLETLLTCPINRNYIVVTKMLSSGLVGLLTAGIYMIGLRNYMGEFGRAPTSGQLTPVVERLGLVFTPEGYFFLGVSLFFAILCGLALAVILGVLAKDLKSAQSLVMPITLLVLIPYFLTMFSDFNSLSFPLKILIWAIPFSHPFLATQNILLANYPPVLYGILYMFTVFAILVLLAARIFSSDRVLTMKLQLRRKGLMGIRM